MKLLTSCMTAAAFTLMVGCGNNNASDTGKTSSGQGIASGVESQGPSYLERRAQFETQLITHAPSPQAWEEETPPAGVKVVQYTSDDATLMAWLAVPEHTEGELLPALVYFHGGFAFGSSDFEVCHPFLDAGYIVMCPTFRGENGNPGDYEMMLGEADDAANAVRWLADQPSVDPDRIYTFGHSSGGVLSAILSLYEDLPIRNSGSAGGLYGPDLFDAIERMVPFKLESEEERQMRLLVGNIAWMKRPHIAFVGTQDTYMKVAEARAENAAADDLLEVISLQGDHHSTLPEAIKIFLEVARADE